MQQDYLQMIQALTNYCLTFDLLNSNSIIIWLNFMNGYVNGDLLPNKTKRFKYIQNPLIQLEVGTLIAGMSKFVSHKFVSQKKVMYNV